ncbi:ABC transporter permease [Sphingobacterium faecale]|uniref:ABC transporter permease n=1 Tax=Sphingobacterium faecale TaxID=2803775 RepID=A0ABS1R725_9SPHI|nr:ABC transporter permease [Sphingobacterium faecale]MBL1410525.1 ABC transporter permease [Sphingobacterium faecale]
MELSEFEFKRERRVGEFVQDFINLLKIIWGHLTRELLRMLIGPLCLMLLVGYYISTQLNLNADYSSGEIVDMLITLGLAALCMLIIGVLAFGFTIEYFILLRDRRDLAFSYKDIWVAFKSQSSKYFRFLLGSVVVGVILLIPIGFVVFISALIPFVGSIAVGIVFAILGLWFFTAFMLYRENYYDLFDTYTSAFSMLKEKIAEYGLASYVVTFLFRSLMTLMSIVPLIILGLIAYNYVGFSNDFFETYIGKILVTFGSTMLTVFFIIYYMLSVISYGIIYETAKELRFGEDVFEKIHKIGRRKNV